MAEVPECLTCGTCCFSQLQDFVRVSGDDYERLGDNVEQLVCFDGVRAHMRMRDGHCAALRLEPESGQLSCSVYALRPKICRDLARGSPECAAERQVKAERPLLALRRATRATPS